MGVEETAKHPYWHGQAIIAQALARNDQKTAASAFRQAIRMMPLAIADGISDYESIPEDMREIYESLSGMNDDSRPHHFFYPFTGQDAFAFAAARNDHESLQILDGTCGDFHHEPEPCSSNYLRIVETIQTLVAANEITDIKDVRKLFSQEDRIRLRSVWRAMRDAKTLIVESQGQKIFFHRVAPEPYAKEIEPIDFRKGKNPQSPLLLKRPEHLGDRSSDRPTETDQSFKNWPLARFEESKVPKGYRITRKSITASVGNSSWLRTVFPSKRTDGSLYFPTFIIDSNGSYGPATELPQGGFRSNPQGDCLISEGKDAVIRLYNTEAKQTLALRLAETPEVREAILKFNAAGDLSADSAIKSVHASLLARRLVISAVNNVFVYTFTGEVVASFQLDHNRTKQILDSHVSLWTQIDWAYFVQLSADGKGIYIGAYSGLLLFVSFSGELLDSWVLPGAPTYLRETNEGISGFSQSREFFYQASRGSGEVQCKFFKATRLVQLIGKHVIFENRIMSGLFDLENFMGWTVELPKPMTAIYEINGQLVIETATTRYNFQR
ncbi:hypothetical protein ACT3UD_14195 [Glutamicibacter sp. 287]|uniref:hypothetical protein n=1 Tax=unclassified Glutamicibacter TaxID=2627139 RepID=UPI004034C616